MYSTGVKHQSGYALSRLVTNGTGNKQREDDLPDLVIASGKYVHDKTTAIVALDVYKSTPIKSVTYVYCTDATPPITKKIHSRPIRR